MVTKSQLSSTGKWSGCLYRGRVTGMRTTGWTWWSSRSRVDTTRYERRPGGGPVGVSRLWRGSGTTGTARVRPRQTETLSAVTQLCSG